MSGAAAVLWSGSSRAPSGARLVAAWASSCAAIQEPAPLAGDVDLADIQASLRGDEDAYRRLIERHQKAVAAAMRRFTPDRRMIEELVHDVFVEAYFSLGTYSARAPFSHWLQRLATRVGYRYWKRRQRASKLVALTAEADIAAAPACNEDNPREQLEIVLGRLSPRDRLVVTLLYLEERSVAETAALTGWSRTMVKVQSYRARRKLRRLLEAMPESGGGTADGRD
jgi:RNA polymerase sigma-70 factor (ECF subfamily)